MSGGILNGSDSLRSFPSGGVSAGDLKILSQGFSYQQQIQEGELRLMASFTFWVIRRVRT